MRWGFGICDGALILLDLRIRSTWFSPAVGGPTFMHEIYTDPLKIDFVLTLM